MAQSITSNHVAILICTCDGATWLQAQLDSFLAQDHDNWTLWVSDDGSVDGTRDILAAFARKHPARIGRILQGPRCGFARNYLELACHPDLPPGFVAFSDQDDVWMPHKMTHALTRLREAGDTPAVWAARYLVTGSDLQPRHVAGTWPRGPSFGNAVVQNILSGHTLTLNPAALALVRRVGVQAVPHHDWWIYLLMAASGARIVTDDAVVLHYRQHGHNTIGVRSTLGGRLRRLRMLFQGELSGWADANLRALQKAGTTITPQAQEFVRLWFQFPASARLRLMRRYGIHRQSRLETVLLYSSMRVNRHGKLTL